MNQDKEFSMGRNDWDSENVSCRAGRLNEQYHRRTAHCWKREIMSFPAMCDTTGADANCFPRNQYFSNIQYLLLTMNRYPGTGSTCCTYYRTYGLLLLLQQRCCTMLKCSTSTGTYEVATVLVFEYHTSTAIPTKRRLQPILGVDEARGSLHCSRLIHYCTETLEVSTIVPYSVLVYQLPPVL